MFRFWYRFVYDNKTLVETGAVNAIWEKKINPFFDEYMGLVFEKICKEYLLRLNAIGKLPFLFTKIGRWWGSGVNKEQIEIDIIASDKSDYLICECKWKKELTGLSVLNQIREKADIFNKNRKSTYFILFSKSGFTKSLIEESKKVDNLLLKDLKSIIGLK